VPKGKAFYVGITTDPPNRLKQHGHPALFYLEGPLSRDEAAARERSLKRLTRVKKQDLVTGFSKQ
jgi:predicted GIY-YIG superfamily endonuclease